MLPDECQEAVDHTRIKFEEMGRKLIVLNEGRRPHIRVRIDGCVLKNTHSCDWAARKKDAGDVLIELKGVDVKHAITQLEATAKYWKDHKIGQGKLATIVVCAQYPKISSFVQRAQDRFRKQFDASLKVVSRPIEASMEQLLEV